MKSLASCILLLAAMLPCRAQTYPDHKQLAARIAGLQRLGGGLLRVSIIGRSYGGREIPLLALAAGDAPAPEQRPALLVVGGLDGSHLLGTELALATARDLVVRHARGDAVVRRLLAQRTVYVVPRANPDGAERFLRRPLAGFSGNDRKLDRDRDGSLAEDGPTDLDGDGQVLWMREKHPEGRWLPDVREPRLLRLADPVRGERGIYKLHREGGDDDGDGELDEDPADGVDPARNFAHRFSMHEDDAGRFPSSEPSARALMELLVGRPNIRLVLVYGLDDNLLAAPAAGTAPPRQPMVKLDPQDLPYYERAGKLYRELTGATGKPRTVPGGTFFEWAYFHRGLPAFSARAWHGPPEEKKQAGQERAPHPDLRWLRLADRLQAGFKPWAPFRHPTKGAVEIGGFTPGFRINPPAAEVAGIVERHVVFPVRLLGLLPELRLADVRAVKLAGGLYRVEAAVVNEGRLPSMTAQAMRNQEVRPAVVRLEGKFELLGARPAGYAQTILGALDGGTRRSLSWVVRASGKLAVRLKTGTGAELRQEVTLP